MTSSPKIPDSQTIKRHADKMREVCQMLDAWTMKLDEAIASAEADIRRNPRNVYLIDKAKLLTESAKLES